MSAQLLLLPPPLPPMPLPPQQLLLPPLLPPPPPPPPQLLTPLPPLSHVDCLPRSLRLRGHCSALLAGLDFVPQGSSWAGRTW